MNLYNLTGELLELQDMLEEAIEDEQMLIDTLEAVQGEYEFKLESYCKVIRNLYAKAGNFKVEARRLADKGKVLENNIARLKKAMFDSMKLTDTKRVDGELFTISIQKNGGKLPVIVDVPEEELPEELVKVQKSADLEAIRKLLENGDSELAHFGERGESLRIK